MSKKMSSSLAQTVAALAASAAKEKPASKSPQRPSSAPKVRAKGSLDPNQKENSSRPPKKIRHKAVEEDEKEEEEGTRKGLSAEPTSADQTRVIVSGLDADTQAEQLEDAFSDAGPVRHIKVAKGGKATVHFVLATDAARCVKDMQGIEIAGTPLKLSLGESAETAAASAAANVAANADKPAPQYTKLNTRLFRIVIRNLPFGIKEAAVRSAFETFGTLEEVHLPLKPGRDGKEQTRGFGFLQYSSRAEAKKALDDGNGMQLLGRPVAVDWAVAKEIYQEMVPSKNKGDDAKKAEDPADGKKRKEPEVGEEVAKAVEEKTAKKEKKVAAVGAEKEDELGRTVFVRNIPLESEEHEVREVMRRFGKMVFCKLVIDKVTGKHKGSAFCQFASPSSAQQACEAGGAFTGTESWEEIQRKKDKRLQGSAVRGVIDGFQETLSMHGRHLFVALAVDRTLAQNMEGKKYY